MLPQSLFQTALSMSPRYNDVLAHAAKLIKDKASTQKTSIQRPASQAMHIPLDGGNTFRLPHGFPMRMVLNSATISDALGIQN